MTKIQRVLRFKESSGVALPRRPAILREIKIESDHTVFAELIVQVGNGTELTENQIVSVVKALTDDAIPAEVKADFLSALARKGETASEIALFARELRGLSIEPPIDSELRDRCIIDVCGTGGDCLNTFNISTTVALLVASAGVPVAKHGNRAITSRSGSADVLEALGIAVDLAPEAAAASLRNHDFAFFFAPQYHPAFKHIAPARRLCADRGQRTIFNFLGPLLNPARPNAQLIGVPHPELCQPIARALQTLGVRRGMSVSGQAGEAWLDELSTLGPTTIAEFYHARGFFNSTVTPDEFGCQPATLTDLAGGDRLANAEITRDLLAGKIRGPKRDAVLLNAAAALFVAERTNSLADGFALAADLIDAGKASAKLRALAGAR